MTQCDRVLRHLTDIGSLTAAEAVSEYGIYRLAARIADLKSMGVPIRTDSIRTVNRYGETVRFARYSLEAE